jgi:hypothetical protein
MKKKGRPMIPDFSRKRPSGPTPQAAKLLPPTRGVVPTPNQIVKPHSTSSKSGRRGS